MLLLKKPRTSQPQVLDAPSGSSLFRGLCMLWTPAGITRNLAGGPPLTQSGAFERTIGTGGRGYIVTNTANSIQWTVPTGLTAATILVLINTSGSSGTYVPYRTNAASVDYAPFNNGLVYSGAFAGARYINGVAFPGGSSYILKPYVVAARGSTVANSHATFVNGTKVGSSNQTFTLSSAITIAADAGAWRGAQRTYLAAFWSRALSDDELFALSANPWQLFQPRRIWVPTIASAGPNTYTFSVSGGVSFAGTSPNLRTRALIPSGGVAFGGTAPITDTNEYNFAVSGGVTFSGAAPLIRENVILPGGGVTFGGTAKLFFVPAGGVGTEYPSRISTGVSRTMGLS